MSRASDLSDGLLNWRWLGLTFHEADIVGERNTWRALVVTADALAILGRDRLLRLRQDQSPGEIDLQILSRVRAGADHLDLIVFRAGSDDGQGRWGFFEDLTQEEANEMAYLLSVSQMPTYRRFLAAGLLAIIHVELDPFTLGAFKHAARRHEEKLEARAGKETDAQRIAAADRWILKNLTFYFGVSFQAATTRLLPANVGLLDAGVRRMRELVGELPAEAID